MKKDGASMVGEASPVAAECQRRVVFVRQDPRANLGGGLLIAASKTLAMWEVCDGCLRVLTFQVEESRSEGNSSSERHIGNDSAVPSPSKAEAVVTVRSLQDLAAGGGQTLRLNQFLVSADVWENLNLPESCVEAVGRVRFAPLEEAPKPCRTLKLSLIRVLATNNGESATFIPPAWLAWAVEAAASSEELSSDFETRKKHGSERHGKKSRVQILGDSFLRILRLSLLNKYLSQCETIQMNIAGLPCLLRANVPPEYSAHYSQSDKCVSPYAFSRKSVVYRVNTDTRLCFTLSSELPNLRPLKPTSELATNESPRGFARLAGCEAVLEEVVYNVLLPLLRPDLFARFGVRQPRGALLTGPPGTGKTFLMQAVAEELASLGATRGEADASTQSKLSFLLTSLTQSPGASQGGRDGREDLSRKPNLVFAKPYVRLVQATELLGAGEAELDARIFDLFEECQQRRAEALLKAQTEALELETKCGGGDACLAPVVVGGGVLLFIDEIDCLCPRREEADRRGRCGVGTFLACLDGLATREGLFVIGATNHPEAIDEAVRRAGRLETEIQVGVPSSEERRALLRSMLSRVPHDLTEEQICQVSDACQGFVPADMALLLRTAASVTLRDSLDIELEKEKEKSFGFGAPSVKEEMKVVSPRLALQHLQSASRLVRPSGLKSVVVQVPHVKWSDIGGYAEAKQKLRECVEWPLKFSVHFSRLAMQPPRGVLLYGPPGCSKTMLAKAVATESRMNFVSVKGPELFSKWIGETERAVRQLFSKARQYAPCVIFFDEIDALGVDRQKSTSSSGVENRVLSQLLTEMDGVGPLSPVVVLAATNRPDLLDAALLRPGRFDRLVYVPLPDAEARRQIASHFFSRCPYTNALAQAASSDLEALSLRSQVQKKGGEFLEEEALGWWVAARTQGFSGAEVVMVCREAGLEAIREAVSFEGDGRVSVEERQLAVSEAHLKEALKRVRPRTPEKLLRFYEEYHSNALRSVTG